MSSSRETIIQEKNIYDIVINKYQSAGKGLSVKHWQRNIELCQICAGEYEFVVGKQYFLAHKGDIVFIPAGELHQLGSNDISSSIRICVFNERLLCNLFKDLHGIKNHIQFPKMEQHNIAAEISSIMDDIFNEYSLQKPEYMSLIQGNLIRLCGLLLRHFKADQPHRKNDMCKLVVMQAVCEYIAQNYTNDISLQDLALATNYSISYISSQFSDIAGVTVKEYLETYRINKVIACIHEIGCSYSVAASMCGFNSIRTFNNAFKRVTGMTPSDFFDGTD